MKTVQLLVFCDRFCLLPCVHFVSSPKLSPTVLSVCLIGYMSYQKRDVAPACAPSVRPFEETVVRETGAAPLMDWDSVKKLLSQRLTASKLDSAFR